MLIFAEGFERRVREHQDQRSQQDQRSRDRPRTSPRNPKRECEAMKTCSKCGQSKPEDDFYVGKAQCKVCRCVASRKYQEANAAKLREQRRERHEAHPEKRREISRKAGLKHHYGITPDQWQQMFDAQNGRCAICGTDAPGKKAFNVDHCHESGWVRGLVCAPCNSGQFSLDTYILYSAVEYMRQPPAFAVIGMVRAAKYA